jgi:hypothetical protein
VYGIGYKDSRIGGFNRYYSIEEVGFTHQSSLKTLKQRITAIPGRTKMHAQPPA